MIEETFHVEGAPRFEIRIQSGEARVLPGESGQVRVVAEARPSAELEVTRRGGTVLITTNKAGWLRNDDAHVTVYASPETEAFIDTASADVKASAPLTHLEVKTASGDVRFTRTRSLEVKTASGDVAGDTVEESASVVTASGDVRVKQCLGKGSFSSASGDIVIDESDGPIEANTVSGETAIRTCKSPEVNIRSMSGSVRLGVPAGTRVQLDATSLSGKVTLPKSREHSITPERTASIKVRLVSGNVTLSRID